jgi:hypothetical protein
VIFPSISFRASDVLGNESSVGYLVSFDNTPPLSDLDPPEDYRDLSFDPSNVARCSWPFDPVGPDAVDDGDLVDQLFDIRARIEDQGNRPKSGTSDFTPIAGIEDGQVQMFILDDSTKPLVVDTDNDQSCDKINPLLRPTTTPKSSSDALLIQLATIPVQGGADHTEQNPDVRECPISFALLLPVPLCQTVFDLSKARWRIYPTNPDGLPTRRPEPHSHYMGVSIGYTAKDIPAIWTIPPAVADAVQCGGRQFDALANNISDGWACIAVDVTDRLGNHQVSQPIRVCIDKDGDRAECPHKSITSTSSAGPIVVQTAAPHGYNSGEVVIVSSVLHQTLANGSWVISVVDANRFALVGSQGEWQLGSGAGGTVVRRSELPDCTGTQMADGPPPVVSNTPCGPWRSFPSGEQRL